MLLAAIWLKGLLVRGSGRLIGAMLGVALAVALLGAIGAFVTSSAASMTERTVEGVPVDWQVQLVPTADVDAVTAAVGQATGYTALEQVGYADIEGLSAMAGGAEQNTGAGKVVGISSQYAQEFPAELRPLIGSLDGVLVAQQTAANLNVTVGDMVTIHRVGLPPAAVQIDGVVDLPNADSFFQAVGVPPGAAPQAPPDDVLVLPLDLWHRLFDPQAQARPDSVHLQLHVRLTRDLPSSPEEAFVAAQQRARNLEARIAGSGLVANNLAARLDGARSDALYARVLFVFLGLPGVILSLVLTLAVAASGAGRRRREQALLRIRGASTGRILALAAVEALSVALGGAVLGVAFAFGAAAAIASPELLATPTTALWFGGAATIGFIVAGVATLAPAWLEVRRSTVAASRVVVGRSRRPLWQLLYLDVLLVVIAVLAFWQTASSGYQVVLAPEGVTQTSVAYQTFLAPVCFWIGVSLLAARVWDVVLGRGRATVSRLLAPIAHGLSGVVAASRARQRALVIRGVVLVALAFSFATSTAIFNTTYNAQSRVDAELTNGADVTVTGTTAAPPSALGSALGTLPGVVAMQLMQHRFAYVGNDLQDLYGIDPLHIGDATHLSNAFFAGGDAAAVLGALANHPDGVLVSEETVTDYQLQPGDLLNLRLQDVRDHQYHVIPFHFVGVVREFPTAPKDSFLVANASYVAQQTGTDAAEIVLLRTSGDPAEVARRVQVLVQALAGARVTDIGTTQRAISSSLTAVDLRGLTRLELSFAVLLVAGSTGLVMGLSLAERRRAFAILAALGATEEQLASFLWSEGLLVLAGGALIGALTGLCVATMLVTVLAGVFDPPPETLAVPWLYLVVVSIAAFGATVLAVLGAQAASRRPVVEALRSL